MLEKLKEYRELITIIVFFLGGFFWLENQFPTKKDLKSEITVLECLLNKYMELTQLQIRGQELEKQIQELNNQINAYADDPNPKAKNLSPAIQRILEDKKSELSTDKADFKDNKIKIESIMKELERNSCGKVTL